MNFPLSLWDVGLWLAAMAIIVLTASELLSSSGEYTGRIVIEKTRLRFIALGLGMAFMVVVVALILYPY